MSQYVEKLLDAIFEIVVERVSQAKFNRTIRGKIIESVTEGYTFLYNNETYVAKPLDAATYLADDMVYILIINNDFSQKIILGKV